MSGIVLALVFFSASGAIAFAIAALGRERLGARVAAGGAALGGVVGLVLAARALATGEVSVFSASWSLPGSDFHLALDPLSAIFLFPICLVGPLAAVYATGYLEHFRGKKWLAPPLLFFNLLLAALTLIVTARDAGVFLFGWEAMTLLAFLLVSFEDEHEEVRAAAFTYVALSHVATMLVFAFFLTLGREAGSLDLDAIAKGAASRTGVYGALLFALALVGFGTKSGIVPLHIWLPRAHPAAPSHVSAVMSAVIVKTALYALVRGLSLLGPPPAWWGGVLLGLGAVTALGGILFGLVQGDLKRLLAYSTIENVGIILLGLGTGLLGRATGNPTVAVLGFTGALLHVVHHSVMKGLLFLGAGAVLSTTHTRSIERLGALLKRMPFTGAAFLVGAAAIAGLPGLAGFASEWLVYAGLFHGGLELRGAPGALAIAAIPALAITGGLAAAALAKAFGLVFLGQPRTPEAAHAEEVEPAMRLPLVVLASLAVLFGIAPAVTVPYVTPVAGVLAGVGAGGATGALNTVLAPLAAISLGAAFLGVIAGFLGWLRVELLSGREVTEGGTWGCGYGSPTARMQYTGASFTMPISQQAAKVLRPRVLSRAPVGIFPGLAARQTRVDDPAEEDLFRPVVLGIQERMLRLRWLQAGRLQLYILYIFVTVVAMLVWQVLGGGQP